MSQLKIRNGNDWYSVPAGGAGVPSGGTAGQILKKSSSTDYATEWANKYDEWTLAGTSTGNTDNVTYPETAKELLVVFKITFNSLKWAYTSMFTVDCIQDVDALFVGGYYYSSSIFGYAFANHDSTNRTLNNRLCRAGDVTTGSVMYVYYR